MEQTKETKHKFLKDISVLLSGTTAAQAIPIAGTPILTRLYSPEEFGVYGFILGIAATASVFANGKYDVAIMQPKNDNDAEVLVKTTLSICAIFFIFTLPITAGIIVAWPQALPKIGITIPIIVFLSGTYSTFTFLLNRKGIYTEINRNKITYSLTIFATSALLGALNFGSAGLLLGTITGYILTLSILFLKHWSPLPNLNIKRALRLLGEYADYPKLSLPAALCNTAAQKLPIIFFSALFGATLSGFYFLVERVLLAPITIIGSSVGTVYRQRAQQSQNNHGSYRSIFLYTLLRLSIIGISTFSVFCLFAPTIFEFAFGEEWRTSGKLAQILTPLFLLRFIVSPLLPSFYISNKLKANLYGQASYAVLVGISITVGDIFNSIEVAVSLLSLSGSVFYLAFLVLAFSFSSSKNVRQSP